MRRVLVHVDQVQGGIQISAGEIVGDRWFRADKVVTSLELLQGGVQLLEAHKKRCLQDLSKAVCHYEATR